jgi:hypothetical protein
MSIRPQTSNLFYFFNFGKIDAHKFFLSNIYRRRHLKGRLHPASKGGCSTNRLLKRRCDVAWPAGTNHRCKWQMAQPPLEMMVEASIADGYQYLLPPFDCDVALQEPSYERVAVVFLTGNFFISFCR